MTETYEVGRGKPPKHTQFQKGQSGNPKGRPKRKNDMASVADKIFSQVKTIYEDGKPVKVTVHELLLRRIVLDALSGKAAAVKEALRLAEQSPKHGRSNPAEILEKGFFELLARMKPDHPLLLGNESEEERKAKIGRSSALPLPAEVHQKQKV
jgi:hypothetical protein